MLIWTARPRRRDPAVAQPALRCASFLPQPRWLCYRTRALSLPQTDRLLCPKCRQPLAARTSEDESLRCGSCQRRFPSVAGIPVLLEQPEKRLELWARQLSLFILDTDEAIRQLAVEMIDEGLHQRTRERLQLVAESLPQHRDAITSLFSDAGISPSRDRVEAASVEGSVLAYYTLLHRDWAWGPEVTEAQAAIDAIAAVVPTDFELGTTLVLGAGTTRLCWDLATRFPSADAIYALDVNPLPYLVAQRLLDGKSVDLFELPGHPRRSTFAAQSRRIKAHCAPPKRLHLLFADGLEPPLPAGSVDTVVTPWFVDQVPKDAAKLTGTIAQLLRAGGSWINHGPFVYDPTRTKPAHRYCGDEFIQLVKHAGFQIAKASYEAMPHLASPLSSHSRSEWVLTMHATKPLPKSDVGGAKTTAMPDWLAPDAAQDAVVPRFTGLGDYSPTHKTVAATLALVDGTRGVAEITKALVAAGEIVADEDAEVVVRGCLKVLWNEQNRPR